MSELSTEQERQAERACSAARHSASTFSLAVWNTCRRYHRMI